MVKKDDKKATEITDEALKAEAEAKAAAEAAAEAARLQGLSDEDARAVARYRVVVDRDNPCGDGEIKAGTELGLLTFTHPPAAKVTPMFLIHAVANELAHIEKVEPVKVPVSEPSEAEATA